MRIRTGSCSNCGACCKPPVIIENPCIELGEDRCKFYTDNENSELYGHCLIYGRGSRPITVVRDRFHNRITQEQISWFNQNCIEYPRAEDAEIGALPPPECGFSFEVV